MTPFEQQVIAALDRITRQLRQNGESPRAISVGGSSSYLGVGEDGTLRLYGDATSWDDLRVHLTSTKLGGANDPAYGAFMTDGGGSTGVYTYIFDQTNEQEVFFDVQLPHAWKQGSTIYPHVHWAPVADGTAGQVVSWGLEYTWSDIGEVFGATAIAYGNAHVPADSVLLENKHYLTPIGSGIAATGKTLSSVLVCRFFRDATGTGATDSFGDDAHALSVDFHYEIDSFGSDTEYTKV